LVVAATDVPKVPKLHTTLDVVPEVVVLQVPVFELPVEVPEPTLAESSVPAVPNIEAVNKPPFAGSPVL
jgi:hypothetical protein